MSLQWDIRTRRHFHSLSICSNGLSHRVHIAPCTGRESESSRLSHVDVAAYPCEQLQNYLNFYCFFA